MPEIDVPSVPPNASSVALIDLVGAAAGDIVLTSRVASETPNKRWKMTADGTMAWGPGDGTFDIQVARGTIGNFIFTNPQASGVVVKADGAHNSIRYFGAMTGGVNRWVWGGSSTGESGSNTGTDLVFQARDDAGTFLRTDLTLTRSTGQWNIAGNVVATTDNALDLGGASNRWRDIRFSRQILATDGVVGTPAYSFASTGNTDTGLYLQGSGSVSMAMDAVEGFRMSSSSVVGISIASTLPLTWSLGSADLKLRRGAANVLAQVNATNQQFHYLYGTTDSDSAPVNYERLEFFAGGAVNTQIRQAQGGTGTARALQIGTTGSASTIFMTNGSQRWYVHPSNGDYRAATDNSFDIGTNAAERPRSVYVGTSFLGAPSSAEGAPTYAFGGNTNTGINQAAGSNQIAFSTAGTNRVIITSTNLQMTSAMALSWTNGTVTGSADVILRRNGANSLAMVNGTNNQNMLFYGTTDSDTSPVNFERFFVGVTGSTATLQHAVGGTGVQQRMRFTAADFMHRVGASDAWNLSTSSHWIPQTDNAFDIGASAANKIRNIFIGTVARTGNGSASAPSWSFNSETNTGFYWSASNDVRLSLSNNDVFRFITSGLVVAATSYYAFGSSGVASPDIFLRRGAANVINQINGVSAQSYILYGTTDSDTAPVNYERMQLQCSSTDARLLFQKGGTGADRNIRIMNESATGGVILRTNATDRWTVGSGGSLFASTDNAVDIGATGSSRPRTLYLGTDLHLQSDTSTLRFGTSGDVQLRRGQAANVLQQAATTNPQIFRVYQTTDSDTAPTNYERVELRTSAGGNPGLFFVKGGTGTDRALDINNTSATAAISFTTNGTTRWTIQSGGSLLCLADNSYDIGATGANRPRDLFLATSIRIGTNPAGAGAVRLANTGAVTGRNAANSGDVEMIQVNASDQVLIGGGGADVKFGRALIALGGGSAPTFGTIGGSGPATAGQNAWKKEFDSTGAAYYIPIWK